MQWFSTPHQSRKTKIAKWLTLIAASVFGIAAAVLLNAKEITLVSPLSAGSRFSFLYEEPNQNLLENKVVYGFLPYWNISDTTIQPELTHLSYFSLAVDAQGTLTDPEYPGTNALKSESLLEKMNVMTSTNRNVDLVIAQFYSNPLTAFLTSEKSQENFLKELDSVLLAYPFNGVNIDFELSGSVDDKLRDSLTNFVKKLRSHLNAKYEGITLSIDVYASAGDGSQLWDIKALEPEVDYIVVMAYDFHQRSSPQAGPVAPLFGGKELWDSDINNHLKTFLKHVPSSKILLGVPFYGYEWQTTSRDAQSHTFPDTGRTASVRRVQTILEQKEKLKVQEHWNEAALSPYISYEENGEIYVIYYENPRSLSYKLDYVRQLDLGGIAIWALGYEGSSRELWQVIERKTGK